MTRLFSIRGRGRLMSYLSQGLVVQAHLFTTLWFCQIHQSPLKTNFMLLCKLRIRVGAPSLYVRTGNQVRHRQMRSRAPYPRLLSARNLTSVPD
eukprot:3618871-Pleurochrysis_carterae.AAC.1